MNEEWNRVGDHIMKTNGGDTGRSMVKKTDEGKRKSTEMLR